MISNEALVNEIEQTSQRMKDLAEAARLHRKLGERLLHLKELLRLNNEKAAPKEASPTLARGWDWDKPMGEI